MTGCAVRLDELPDEPPGEAPPEIPAPEPLARCALLADAEGAGGAPGAVARVSGRARRIPLPDGSPGWLVGALARGDGAEQRNVIVPARLDLERCGAAGERAAAPAFDVASPELVEALAPAIAEGARWLYVAVNEPAPGELFGVRRRGVGVARFDEGSGRYVAGDALLWTADRPAFGEAVRVEGEIAYVYGCRPSGFLSGECFVARAPIDHLDDPSAYEYARGAGHWTSDIDGAFPLFTGAASIAVAHDARRDRYLAAYVPPLGRELVMRSGLGPDGPWSAPREIARCALPSSDGDAFCSDAEIHLDVDPGRPAPALVLSHAVASFTSGAAERDPRGFWTRLVVAAPELP